MQINGNKITNFLISSFFLICKLTNSETVFTRNCTLIFPHPLIELHVHIKRSRSNRRADSRYYTEQFLNLEDNTNSQNTLLTLESSLEVNSSDS